MCHATRRAASPTSADGAALRAPSPPQGCSSSAAEPPPVGAPAGPSPRILPSRFNCILSSSIDVGEPVGRVQPLRTPSFAASPLTQVGTFAFPSAPSRGAAALALILLRSAAILSAALGWLSRVASPLRFASCPAFSAFARCSHASNSDVRALAPLRCWTFPGSGLLACPRPAALASSPAALPDAAALASRGPGECTRPLIACTVTEVASPLPPPPVAAHPSAIDDAPASSFAMSLPPFFRCGRYIQLGSRPQRLIHSVSSSSASPMSSLGKPTTSCPR